MGRAGGRGRRDDLTGCRAATGWRQRTSNMTCEHFAESPHPAKVTGRSVHSHYRGGNLTPAAGLGAAEAGTCLPVEGMFTAEARTRERPRARASGRPLESTCLHYRARSDFALVAVAFPPN